MTIVRSIQVEEQKMLLNVSSELLPNKEFQDEIDLFIRNLFSVIPTNVVEAPSF
jgi:hypothetical protein